MIGAGEGDVIVNEFANAYSGRRVLVTGHTGFKGSWLVAWLQHLGAHVAGFSDLVPTGPAMFDLLGLENRIENHWGDIRDRSRLGEAIDHFRPEFVFHLAAQALVLESLDNPVETFETNVMGMVNLLECVRERPWIDVVVLATRPIATTSGSGDIGRPMCLVVSIRIADQRVVPNWLLVRTTFRFFRTARPTWRPYGPGM